AFKYKQKEQTNPFVKLSVDVSDKHATIVVSDNGIGISPEHIGDIFKLFFRGSDQAKGMGFGLYNVQNALLKLQGSIDVQSPPNMGTTFTVRIPSK
ncbi:MAG: sensor histidine kinase, partial [Sphingobacterium sp.]